MSKKDPYRSVEDGRPGSLESEITSKKIPSLFMHIIKHSKLLVFEKSTVLIIGVASAMTTAYLLGNYIDNRNSVEAKWQLTANQALDRIDKIDQEMKYGQDLILNLEATLEKLRAEKELVEQRNAEIQTKLDNYLGNECRIDFRDEIDQVQSCLEIGEFQISGTSLEGWNTKTSVIEVPDGWAVSARYETWLPPRYDRLDTERSGFIQLNSGVNNLHLDRYQIYHDEDMNEQSAMSKPGELNDRIQYLIIHKTGNDSVKIWNHSDQNNPDRIDIALVK